ncbi:MAG TPA: SatD family protein [Opitutaceae bacterium]|nr:SatD family protein [Opitutaceae bacterium]
MKYLVLIADVVGSRQVPGRARFQRRLKQELAALNVRRRLASPYTLTLGDEFQAVHRDAAGVFADIFTVLARVAPVRLRFALAVGEIVTPVNPEQAIGMDGSAFHRARAQLERLKREGRLFAVQDGRPEPDQVTMATLNVLSGQVEGWKPTRCQLFAGLLEGGSPAELAKRTGITIRAVNKNIRAAELDEWRLILQNIERALTAELKSR